MWLRKTEFSNEAYNGESVIILEMKCTKIKLKCETITNDLRG